MKTYLSFVLAFIIFNALTIQSPPDTLWTKIFGGQNPGGCDYSGDVGRDIELSDDDGFIISGWTNSFGSDNADVWYINTDKYGNITRTFAITVNHNTDDAVNDMQRTFDGGYILTGIADVVKCYGGHGAQWVCGGKVLLIRTNELGDTLWTRKYDAGDTGWSEGYAVQQTIEGGFIITGKTETEENGTDVLLLLTDDKGHLLWNHVLGNSGYEESFAVQQTDDGGFVLVGSTNSTADESQRIWLIRTNELGDTLWTRKYIAGKLSDGRSLLQMDDGGFLIAGAAEDWNENITGKSLLPQLVKQDPQTRNKSLNPALIKKLKTSDKSQYANMLAEWEKESNKSETVTRQREQYQSHINQGKVIQERDALIIRTNALGDTLWTRIYGGTGWDNITTLSPTNNGYILAGEQYIPETDSQDLWLVSIDDEGSLLWSTTLGDSALEAAYDVKQTFDNGYIVLASKYNDEFGMDQLWLVRYAEEVTGNGLGGDKTPEQFILRQNYPNPFNSTTTIRYTVAKSAHIILKVYDALGREIKVLVNEHQSAGQESITWDGTDKFGQFVASGIYIYRLDVDNKKQMRKMVLIK